MNQRIRGPYKPGKNASSYFFKDDDCMEQYRENTIANKNPNKSKIVCYERLRKEHAAFQQMIADLSGMCKIYKKQRNRFKDICRQLYDGRRLNNESFTDSNISDFWGVQLPDSERERGNPEDSEAQPEKAGLPLGQRGT